MSSHQSGAEVASVHHPLGTVSLMHSLLWGPRREWLSGLPAASPDSFPGNRAPAFRAR